MSGTHQPGRKALDAAQVRVDRVVAHRTAATAAMGTARLLGERLEVLAVGEQGRPLEGRKGDWPARLDQPALEPDDVVAVAIDRPWLRALEGEVVKERLVHFFERRRGICGLVHVEAPSASADLVWVLIRRWLREPRRGRLVVNPTRLSLPMPRAGVAQLAERQPSKLHVASSNLVSRSKVLASRARHGVAGA